MKKLTNIINHKQYHLQYIENDLLIFKYFHLKKDLDLFIKQIPKNLKHFSVTCDRYISTGKSQQIVNTVNMTNLYVKEELRQFILK